MRILALRAAVDWRSLGPNLGFSGR